MRMALAVGGSWLCCLDRVALQVDDRTVHMSAKARLSMQLVSMASDPQN